MFCTAVARVFASTARARGNFYLRADEIISLVGLSDRLFKRDSLGQHLIDRLQVGYLGVALLAKSIDQGREIELTVGMGSQADSECLPGKRYQRITI